MKKVLKYTLFIHVLFINMMSSIYAKDPTATVYGVHEPIDTSLGGIEWLFVVASASFVMGLILIANGKALKNAL